MEKQLIQVEISGELGARTIAEMVQIASKYESSMHIEFKELTVNAKSIMGMMSLHIENGAELTVVAEGADEADALADLGDYIRGKNAFA